MATLVFVFVLTKSIFKSQSYTCINYKINTLPYEPIECSQSKTELFADTIEWPFGLMVSPALITCLSFGIFASLVSPFAGFLASGMKRAWQIKDFATTLPGHGGFLDRFDCTIFANIFMMAILTQVLYKETIALDDISTRFTELDLTQ